MLQGQANLVPNGSFEEKNHCPSGLTWRVLDDLKDWSQPTRRGSTDYFNRCAPLYSSGVPNNIVGIQEPASGDAYAGIILGGPGFGYREYLQVEITEPLIKDSVYYIEFKISLAESSIYSCGAIGIALRTERTNRNIGRSLPYEYTYRQLLPENADTESWQLISGFFTAKGGECYLIIGNFDNSRQAKYYKQNKKSFFHTTSFTYYYVDDVFIAKWSSAVSARETEIRNKVTHSGIGRRVTSQYSNCDIDTFELFVKQYDTHEVTNSTIFYNADSVLSQLSQIAPEYLLLVGHADSLGSQIEVLNTSKEFSLAALNLLQSRLGATRIDVCAAGSSKPKRQEGQMPTCSNNRVEVLYRKNCLPVNLE